MTFIQVPLAVPWRLTSVGDGRLTFPIRFLGSLESGWQASCQVQELNESPTPVLFKDSGTAQLWLPGDVSGKLTIEIELTEVQGDVAYRGSFAIDMGRYCEMNLRFAQEFNDDSINYQPIEFFDPTSRIIRTVDEEVEIEVRLRQMETESLPSHRSSHVNSTNLKMLQKPSSIDSDEMSDIAVDTSESVVDRASLPPQSVPIVPVVAFVALLITLIIGSYLLLKRSDRPDELDLVEIDRGCLPQECFEHGKKISKSAQESNGELSAEKHLQAAAFYKLACHADIAAACTNLAHKYLDGLGVERDRLRARRLYQSGCEGYSAVGCTSLGNLYAKGLGGVAQDYQQAAIHFSMGCEGGDMTGCTNHGLCIRRGQGEPQDHGRAADLFYEACHHESPSARGCTLLGVVFEKGEGRPFDPHKALEYYGLGCDLEDPTGCENQQRVCEQLAGSALCS